MNKTKKIKVSTKALFVSAIALLVVAAIILPIGIGFLVYYLFFDTTRDNQVKINCIDTSFVLISLALGFAATSFSLLQIRNRYVDLNDKGREGVQKIYSFYRVIYFDSRFKDLIEIIDDLSAPYLANFEELYEKFKDAEEHPQEFFDKFDEIDKNIFTNKLENTPSSYIKKYDQENPTIQSQAFIDLFKSTLFVFEELSMMCINLLCNDDDVTYEQYIVPFIVSSYKKFVPFIFYFGFDFDVQNFTLFTYSNKLK